MSRIALILAFIAASAGTVRCSVDVYPPLTRETLVGTWEGFIGAGTVPMVFHMVFTSRDNDSYLSEIHAGSMQGTLYRLETCQIEGGKIYLLFCSTRPNDDSAWWIDGEGYGDQRRAWIWADLGTGYDKPHPGPKHLYLERSTWVRGLGDAALRAAEKIKDARERE